MRFLSRSTMVSSLVLSIWVGSKSADTSTPDQNAEEGMGSLELCLVLPLIVLILAAATDLSFMCQKYLVVVDAAAVGARFGSSGMNSSNLTGMQNAAQGAAGGINGFTATATTFCSCSPGGSQISCSSSCPSQLGPLQYVQVSTNAPVSFPFKALGLSATAQLAGSSVMRVSGATQ